MAASTCSREKTDYSNTSTEEQLSFQFGSLTAVWIEKYIIFPTKSQFINKINADLVPKLRRLTAFFVDFTGVQNFCGS